MTPKTLDKYIAALKKKAAAEGWSQAEYEAAVWDLHGEMADQLSDGKISQAEYDKALKQIQNAQKSMVLQGKKNDAFMASVDSALNNVKAAQSPDYQFWKKQYDKMLADGTITKAQYDGYIQQLTPVTQTGMSHDEYINLWESLNKKKKAGLITQDEYYQLGRRASRTPRRRSGVIRERWQRMTR